MPQSGHRRRTVAQQPASHASVLRVGEVTERGTENSCTERSIITIASWHRTGETARHRKRSSSWWSHPLASHVTGTAELPVQDPLRSGNTGEAGEENAGCTACAADPDPALCSCQAPQHSAMAEAPPVGATRRRGPGGLTVTLGSAK